MGPSGSASRRYIHMIRTGYTISFGMGLELGRARNGGHAFGLDLLRLFSSCCILGDPVRIGHSHTFIAHSIPFPLSRGREVGEGGYLAA
jgi:hypothetical protein